MFVEFYLFVWGRMLVVLVGLFVGFGGRGRAQVCVLKEQG